MIMKRALDVLANFNLLRVAGGSKRFLSYVVTLF